MTKYRIKNEAIEKAVRGLFKTQEAFEKELNHWSEHHFKYHPYYSCIKIEANSAESITGFTCELYVATSDIEEVVEYNPKTWNDISKVKPPKQGLYRVEWRDAQGVCRKYDVHWFDGHHFMAAFESMHGPLTAFFKPWDDEEIKE